MSNIVKFEFKQYYKQAIYWSIAIICFQLIFVIMFPAFSNDVDSLNKLLNSYDPTLLKGFGLGDIGLDKFSGFYSFCLVYIIMIVAIYSINIGLNIIGKEAKFKTNDFLLTKPINRLNIMKDKILVALILVLGLNVIYTIAIIISVLLSGIEIEFITLLLFGIGMLFTSFLFLSIGIFIACYKHKIKSSITLAIGITSIAFVIEMIANVLDNTIVNLLSPLSYLSPNYIASNNCLDISMLILTIVLTVLFIILGVKHYIKKDIYNN
ncbi:MAG: ABC transporter permease subunit [Erysipelotrichaceae bacterium]